MFNPSRRNRNIGTAHQGHGQNNRLNIPQRPGDKHYVESLTTYTKQELVINDHQFLFVIEETRDGSFYACSVEEVKRMISYIPPSDYGELKLIVFRQPKRKEEIISPVWGRLIYNFEFENDSDPAIVLESANYSGKLKWPRALSIDNQKELDKLKEDGHVFIDDGRFLTAELTPENIRSTQLYRTIPHEFGHYVHYLSVVERPGTTDEDFDIWERRYDYYRSLPSREKESFANRYAEELKKRLIAIKAIPFADEC